MDNGWREMKQSIVAEQDHQINHITCAQLTIKVAGNSWKKGPPKKRSALQFRGVMVCRVKLKLFNNLPVLKTNPARHPIDYGQPFTEESATCTNELHSGCGQIFLLRKSHPEPIFSIAESIHFTSEAGKVSSIAEVAGVFRFMREGYVLNESKAASKFLNYKAKFGLKRKTRSSPNSGHFGKAHVRMQ